MNKKYAIIEEGLVVNVIIATEDPSYMTDLLCIEVDDTVEVNYIYNGGSFIKNEISIEEELNTTE
jgi:hypothetical protein